MKKQVLYQGKPAIWPLPNKCDWGDDFLCLPYALSLKCDDCFADEAELFMRALAGDGIAVERATEGAMIRACLADNCSIYEEGYLLDVSAGGILLQAGAPAGMFYAFQALTQLIENSEGGCVPYVKIEDSPFKPVRGAHFYVPPRKDLPWFHRFLDFLAKYKINTIFLEMGASMQFDSHPELNEAWEAFCGEMRAYPGGPDSNHWGDRGMQMLEGNIKNSVHIENGGGSYLTKAEMAEIAGLCRQRHIEIIPEVQGLSHSYWMLLAHKDLAERNDDRYPDTWCPSNPKTYEIYFDCLQEIVDVLRPSTVSLGHDEYQWVGVCERCIRRTGHDIFAEDVLKCHDWFKERGIRTHVWSDKFYNLVKKDEVEIGMGSGGGKHLNFNQRTMKNELVKPTYRALDRMPGDLLLSDWYYSAGPTTQDMFNDRGIKLLFGNFHPGSFHDMEARLRRPNVLGAEVSLWHETSDLGMTMTDNYAKYLEAANILWHKGYRFKKCEAYNRVISQIYPAERDRMNGAVSPSAAAPEHRFIDISGLCNAPLRNRKDYGFIATAEPMPNAIPFEICPNVSDIERDAACLLVGSGEAERACVEVRGKYRSIAFLHSYTAALAGPPAHACTYSGAEEDIVGHYVVEYADGSIVRIPVEYSRTIYTCGSAYAFGAQRANPVYQQREMNESVEDLAFYSIAGTGETNRTVFAFEWVNPDPEKEILMIAVTHDPEKPGGIVLFGVTGII